jgi:propanol-preferring alcohol dehydrogenase
MAVGAPQRMQAALFEGPGRPLRLAEVAVPKPAEGQLLLKVKACAVCRTDLHLLDGEVPVPHLPRILGHQIVATVAGVGPGVENPPALGSRVGVPWLGFSCGRCRFCLRGQENLCPNALFTGRDLDGGYAQWTVADHRYCFPLPDPYADIEVAPLLCAGLIGYRALRFCAEAERIGLYGFGASAHILAQVIAHQGREAYAFTREGDREAQSLALDLGCVWAGPSTAKPPKRLEAAILFAPVGSLVVEALQALEPGGVVVCAGIHMSPIPSFPYSLLWEERVIRSVANLTRADGEELLSLAGELKVRTKVTTYPLAEVERALSDLRRGAFTGSAVVVIE